MDITTLDQFKDEIYGVKGTPRRDNLERELETLRIGVQIRNARQKKEMTQAQLAERINKKRTFISKVENDGGNLTLKTLIDIVERGLGGKLNIEVKNLNGFARMIEISPGANYLWPVHSKSYI